ncbi:MAG: hypothetical protein KDA77_23320, partial [Planctomycetaceae bacterium]|nr:hypothetical protein [Planctomycetaceae bacterium]
MLRIPGASSAFPAGEMTGATVVHPSDRTSLEAGDSSGVLGRLGPSMDSQSGMGDSTVQNLTIAEKNMFIEAESRAEQLLEEDIQIAQEHGTLLRAEAKEQRGWIREIWTTFARVTRTFQLYDANNNAVRDALAALYYELMSYLQHFQEMVLEVELHELKYEWKVVYENDDRENSIAFKLFRDGVRIITLRAGLNWQELAQLLKILGMRYNGVHMFEDDIATLFWKADMKHVEVVAIEGFGFERDDSSRFAVEDLVQRMRESKNEADEEPEDAKANRFRGAALTPAIREENAQGLIRTLQEKAIHYGPVEDKHLDALIA